MIAEISAAMSSLNATKDIVQGLVALRDAEAVASLKVTLQNSIIDAQQLLLTAQEKQAALTARVADLEEQIVRFNDWSAEQERYELQAVCRGAYAYAMKPEVERAQPPHWLCACCFGERKKSILQRMQLSAANRSVREWSCPSCKNGISIDNGSEPAYREAQ